MSSGLSNISIARGFHRKLFQCGLIGLVLNIVLNLALIPHFGIRGSAAATTLCEVVISLVMTRIVRRDLDVTVHIFRTSWKPIIAGAIPCAAQWQWYESGKEGVLTGFVTMIITGCSFLGILALLKGIPRDLTSVIREFIRRG
jgi:O-antigen/teichoic acid export membrane protein